MAEANPNVNQRFRLNNVRVDWPNLFKGEQYEGKGPFRCGATLLLPPEHPQFKQIEAAVIASATAKWKDKAPALLRVMKTKDNLCLRNADDNGKSAKSDGYAGMYYISANCKGGETEPESEKPKVYSQSRGLIEKASDCPIYRGCYVNAVIEIYSMEFNNAEQVNCKLIGIQFDHDGDAFGSAPARADDFEDVSEGAGAGLF